MLTVFVISDVIRTGSLRFATASTTVHFTASSESVNVNKIAAWRHLMKFSVILAKDIKSTYT